MATVFVSSYRVTDPDTFAKYNPGSVEQIMKVLKKHGGELVTAGPIDVVAESTTNNVGVILKFPTAAAVQAWHDDPDYAEARAIRESCTTDYCTYMLETPPAG